MVRLVIAGGNVGDKQAVGHSRSTVAPAQGRRPRGARPGSTLMVISRAVSSFLVMPEQVSGRPRTAVHSGTN